MLHGVTIQLLEKEQTGVDAFNRPVYTETAVDVENVLVGEPSTSDRTDALNLYGKHVAYVVGIPKEDAHEWENKRVVFPAPFAGTFQTFGFAVAGIEENIPLSWNKKIMVERYG